MTISCLTCNHPCSNISKYFSHQWVHRYTPNITFPCPFPNCGRVLARYKNLCDHKRRHARPFPSSSRTDDGPGFISCTLTGCIFKAPSPLKFLNHIDAHVRKGQLVTCFCGKIFKVSSSLRSHFRRSHSNSSFEVKDIDNAETRDLPEPTEMEVDAAHCFDNANELSSEDIFNSKSGSVVSDDDFLKSFALMLLRLQSKSFLSATTLQFVSEAIRDISDHAVEYERQVFKQLAEKYNIEPHVQAAIEHEVFNKPVHDLAVGDRGALRSEHMRRKFYKDKFDLLEPVEYVLNNGVEQHKYHYVPIKQSYASLLKDKSVQKLYNQKKSNKNILSDFEDGLLFKKNRFFLENPNGIKVILYIDAFEPCDALKAARGNHKILGVYSALGNMPSYCRSSRDPIQLVMLVKDRTVKTFSYEEVFAPLLEDLKSLHDEGIKVNFQDVHQIMKGCLVAICSDNLEAHIIGGFNQAFSMADFYCRFCFARRAKRLCGDVTPCGQRTCLNYDRDAELADEKDKSSRGVWEASVFNTLSDYHCIGGLPPCIAHDVAEGILPKDLFLALKILVKKKWFTWNYINSKVKVINGKASSVGIRKIEKKNKKIIGSASSNLRLLQIITLALFEKVEDPDNLAWQMIVTLQEFMALVGAPLLSVDQTFHMEVLGEKYISLRKKVLPNVSLKCKHHYILHYGFLTRLHGPLQRWSTIRFESKHQYFKQAANSTHNFINPTLSLSKRHQYLQAYLREGNMFPTVVEAASVLPFKQDLYSPEFMKALEASTALSTPTQLFTTSSAKYHGILYSVGEVLMIKSNDDGSILSLQVDMIIVENKFSHLIFIGSEKLIKYHQYFGIHEIVGTNKGLVSCRADQLASQDPLKPINIGEFCFTCLKHTILI